MRATPAPILIVTGPSGVGKSTVSRSVATAFDKSVLLRMDDFTTFVVGGWIEPWLPESAHQNEVLGGAVAAAAVQFAEGGYTVVVDGVVFPHALDELVRACAHRGVRLHYTVLRADLATCLERTTSRGTGERPDQAGFAELHARFVDLGEHEANVIDATGTADEVAAAVLAGFRSGRLAKTERSRIGGA